MSAPDLIEVVARAICRQHNIDDGYADNGTLAKSIDKGMWLNHHGQAKAALDAINASGTHVVAPVVATGEMSRAPGKRSVIWALFVGRAWCAMIYAAMIQAIPKVTP